LKRKVNEFHRKVQKRIAAQVAEQESARKQVESGVPVLNSREVFYYKSGDRGSSFAVT